VLGLVDDCRHHEDKDEEVGAREDDLSLRLKNGLSLRMRSTSW
jgi:hypothetical protein